MNTNRSDWEDAEFGRSTPTRGSEENENPVEGIDEVEAGAGTDELPPIAIEDADSPPEDTVEAPGPLPRQTVEAPGPLPRSVPSDAARTSPGESTPRARENPAVDAPRPSGRVRNTTEEATVNMTRARFLQILGLTGIGAAVAGTVGLNTVGAVWNYVTRDSTIEELAERSSVKLSAPRTVSVRLPKSLTPGANAFVYARQAGSTAWDQIVVENGNWILQSDEFPRGGDVQMTLGIIRDEKLTILDTPSLGTVQNIGAIR